MKRHRLNDYLRISDSGHSRFERLYEGYRRFYEDPDDAEPKIIINVPPQNPPSWEEQLADPLLMLAVGLDQIRSHIEIGDDYVPAVRVNFGTAQVAFAFGCEPAFPTNSLPAAGTHVLKKAEDVYRLAKPSLDAGWFGKLREWTDIWLDNLPEGVHIYHPDIQSAFNTAHLVRGNDILTDFYDNPQALEALLTLVTDYMIELVPVLKSHISADKDWFFDWGAMWKGGARISNCTVDLIGPDFYREFVLRHDIRLLKSIGGGRVHCCASSGEVIKGFFANPEITGLDFDAGIHNAWEMAELAPKTVSLVFHINALLGRKNGSE